MSSGGSKSSSSTADYNWPSYMKNAHSNTMGNGNISKNVTTLVSEAINNIPHDRADFITYKPDVHFDYMNLYLCDFRQVVESIVPESNWRSFWTTAKTAVDSLIDDSLVEDAVEAHSDKLFRDLEFKTLPLYRRGMQNINAVVSSAYPLGEAWLHREVLAQVAQFSADARLKVQQNGLALIDSAVSQMLSVQAQHTNYRYNLMQNAIDVEKTGYQVFNAYHETYNSNLTGRGIWALEATKYMAEILRSIMGGGTASNQATKDPVLAAIGGGITGAATGAVVGSVVPGVGTALGAGIGGALGIAAGLFG